MSELSLSNYVYTTGALAMLDSLAVVYAKMAGLTEKERNSAIVNCSIPYLKMQTENGQAKRPLAFLDKYLNGSGENEDIDLSTVLLEDKGVKGSVHRQISTLLHQLEFFKHTGLDLSKSGHMTHAQAVGASDNAQAYKQKLSAFQSKELLLDIPQSDFQLNDWKNTIGSFNLSWSLVDVRSDKKAVFAKLWGTTIYRWHPEIPRKSQVVHRAAERLKAFGAKDFKMVFRPCLISVTTGDLSRL